MSKSSFEFMMTLIGVAAIVMTSATLYYLGTAFVPGLLLFVPCCGMAGCVLAPFHRRHYDMDWWDIGTPRWSDREPALWQIASLSVVLVCLLLWIANPVVYYPGEVTLPIRYFPEEPAPSSWQRSRLQGDE